MFQFEQDEEQAETRQLPDGGYGIIISRESHEEGIPLFFLSSASIRMVFLFC